MSSIIVKTFRGDEIGSMQISLELLRDGKLFLFEFNRMKNGLLESTYMRIQLSLAKKMSKLSKKQKRSTGCRENVLVQQESDDKKSEIESESTFISVELFHNEIVFPLSTTNEDAWIDGAVLKIGREEIAIVLNPPNVTLRNLPNLLMVGIPLYPSPKYEFVQNTQCKFFWKTIPEKDLTEIQTSVYKDACKDIDLSQTICSVCFTPSVKDIGLYVLLACIPKKGDRTGKTNAVISKSKISEGPVTFLFEKRHAYTAHKTDQDRFRVMSYNTLSNMYADSDFNRNELFPYCPPHAIDIDYRKNLILKEILGYQADILCMQEVDKSIFCNHVDTALSLNGFTGLFKSKVNNGEGCATFVRDSRFTIIKELDIVLSHYLETSSDCQDIWSEVCKSAGLKLKLKGRSSVLQVTIIRNTDNPKHLICVANTHLYWHPKGHNVRLIHGATAMRYLRSVCQKFEQDGFNTHLVFCGDFNSDHLSGIYQLFTTQFVNKDSNSWSSGGPEEHINTLELKQTMNITSACGTPQYTLYTGRCQRTLDYIFIDSDKLQVEYIVPMPDISDVAANVALPSVDFPSDHIALVCDLKCKY